MEEIYFFLSGEGIMIVGEDEFPVKPALPLRPAR
jgi:mannose-6-phosphate isomerase-like protein (cupin superfamily)